MRVCCRDMALLLRNGVVRLGSPSMDTVIKNSVDNIVLPTPDFTFYLHFCPFCGKELKVEFDKEE